MGQELTGERLRVVQAKGASTADIATHAALTTVHGVPNLLPKQMIENDPILLDAALSASAKYCGICEVGTSGTTLVFGDVVYYLAASSRWMKTLANTATTSNGKLGVACNSAVAAETLNILLWGKINASNTYPAMSIGSPIFLSAGTAGYITGTASAGTTGYVVRIIGYGNTADELYFHPDNTYLEMA